MTIFPNLGAAADGCPGIDHGAVTNIGTEVDERRHQNNAFADIGRAPDNAIWHCPEPSSRKTVGVPPVKLGGNFIKPGSIKTRPACDGRHVVQPKREENCFLEPLIHMPRAILFARDPHLAAVKVVEREVNRLADGALRRHADVVARFPSIIDGLFE